MSNDETKPVVESGHVLFKGPAPELPAAIPQSGPASRRAMEVGAGFADKQWDAVLRFKSVDFVVGFLVRIFSFIASCIGAEQTLMIFEAVKTGVLSLSVMQTGKMPAKPTVDIVFNAPPGNPPPQFVEVENQNGASISYGEWIDRKDGTWALRIPRGE